MLKKKAFVCPFTAELRIQPTLQKEIKPEDLLSWVFEGKVFLLLGTPLLVDKKQHIELPRAKSVPVFVTCEVEPVRQHKLPTLLDLEVAIPKSLGC